MITVERVEGQMLTFDDRCNVKERYLVDCKEHCITDCVDTGAFLDWLGMMGLLDEEAVKALPEG